MGPSSQRSDLFGCCNTKINAVIHKYRQENIPACSKLGCNTVPCFLLHYFVFINQLSSITQSGGWFWTTLWMGKATDARELWGPIHRYIYWQRWTLKKLMSPLLTSTVYWLWIEFRVYSEGISNSAHGANCKHDWNPVHPHDVGRQQLALWRDHICACKSGMLPRSGDSCPFPDMVLCVWSHAPALFLCTYVYKSN